MNTIQNMSKRFLLLVMACLLTSLAFGQGRTITGTVTDIGGESIPGVTVIEMGTNNGTITDLDGRYSLTVNEGASVQFRYVGMITETVAVGDQTSIDISLSEDLVGLDEVQVVAYGTKTRREITGAIGHVETEVVERNVGTNVAGAIQGRTAGVQITNVAGDRGVRIRIRGVTSLLSSSEPLVVLDGVPTQEALSDINPNDILSMEVLKDASASVLYGSRAANGVILITTKSGSSGKSKIDVSYQHGITTPSNKDISLLSGPEYSQVLLQAWQNRYPGRTDPPSVSYDGYDGFQAWDQYDSEGNLVAPASNFDTDWLSPTMTNGYYDRVSISTSGGNERTSFYFSGQYRHDDLYMRGTEFSRVNARLKVDHKVTDWMTAGINFSAMYDRNHPFTDGGGFSSAQGGQLPIYPMYSTANPNRYWWEYDEAVNFLATSEMTSSPSRRVNLLEIAYLDLEPIPGLHLRSEWALNFGFYHNEGYRPAEMLPYGYGESTGDGRVTTNRGESEGWNTNNTATYTRTFLDDHKVTLMGGFTAESSHGGGGTAFQEGLPSHQYYHSNGVIGKLERVSSGFGQRRYFRYISRLNYSFRNKYFVEGSFLKEGSSKFGSQYRWGNFPGGAVSWAFSEEAFVKNNLPFLYFGKLRASYGFVGNASGIGDFGYLGTTLPWFTYGQNTGVIFQNIGNQGLRWERTKQINVGIDYAIFKGRVSGAAEYWYKLSDDLLQSYSIGMFHGYWDSNIQSNIGSMLWEGYEFSVNTVNIEGTGGRFKWATDFNITFTKSEMVKLAKHYFERGTNRAIEGEPLGVYYLAQWAGVDPVTGHELVYEVDPELVGPRDDIGGSYISDLTGNVLDTYSMVDGNFPEQRVIDPEKTPYPDFYGGFNNVLSYKGVELSILFSYTVGQYLYNDAERSLDYVGGSSTGGTKLLDGWTAENPTNIPLIAENPMGGRSTNKYLYDGSFVRLRQVQLAYTLPKKYSQRLKLDRMRFYVSGQNLLLFTKYPGLEPEASYDYTSNVNPGVIGFTNPQARTFLFGIDISF